MQNGPSGRSGVYKRRYGLSTSSTWSIPLKLFSFRPFRPLLLFCFLLRKTMQLYALDDNGQWVEASQALRGISYRCVECKGEVRMRAGDERQAHFYHLGRPESCRQHGKGLEHLQTQLYITKVLPMGACQLEVRFPKIDRIADAVWEDKKLIFEIQFSPITAQEIKSRNLDYKKQGYQVVWILHDKRYNQSKITGAEKFLFNKPHYFTNMDINGAGSIYDQQSYISRGKRVREGQILPIDISVPSTNPLFFAGDVKDLINREIIKRQVTKSHFLTFLKPFRLLYSYIFQFLLEKACK